MELYELFVQPAYFPELLTTRPCVIIGGRGTGKTTVLRGLSYLGQYELRDRPSTFLEDSPYFGLYYKVNGNRVRAFTGEELSRDRWSRLFAHYANLQICLLLLEFLGWVQEVLGRSVELPTPDLTSVATSLHISPPRDIAEMRTYVGDALLRVEASINNDPSTHPVDLSIQGAPIDLLFAAVSRQPEVADRPFFICIDEYEIYLDYQQQVVNTLLKQSSSVYTFKIGVRELGWRARSILAGAEPLISPADYVRVDLGQRGAGREFDKFAADVVSSRLGRYATLVLADGAASETEPNLTELLPSLGLAEEADRLGAGKVAQSFLDSLKAEATSETLTRELANLSPLELAVLDYWRKAQGLSHEQLAEEYLRNRRAWDTRLVNYAFASLFTIRQGKVGIRKYYAGWPVMLRMAAGNIRYLLELVERGFLLALADTDELLPVVTPELQTRAAHAVGEKNLMELEQIDEYGPDLMRLVLGLGRVFQVMAANPHGHTPEVNQFYVESGSLSERHTNGLAPDLRRLTDILTAAVGHLALLRSPGTKPTDEASTRADDYMLHPVYAAFFQFSYRRKRKMRLEAEDVLGFLDRPRHTIRDVLERTRSEGELDLGDVPDQLLLFESYYDAPD